MDVSWYASTMKSMIYFTIKNLSNHKTDLKCLKQDFSWNKIINK